MQVVIKERTKARMSVISDDGARIWKIEVVVVCLEMRRCDLSGGWLLVRIPQDSSTAEVGSEVHLCLQRVPLETSQGLLTFPK